VTIPWSVRKPVRRLRNAVAGGRDAVRQLPRWRAVAATPSRADELAVSYGVERMALADDVVYGGAVKFQLLHEQLPNAPRDFNVLYLGSSSLPAAAPTLVRLARRRSAAFVWNQNGVAYPGWYGNGWELVNAPRARLLHEADHVFFQSAFCKVGADRYYGERQGPWEVLHNPVDTQRFRPPDERPARPLTLLLGGNQYQRYRLLAALDAFALVRLERPEARLLVAGALSFAEDGPAQTVAALHERGLAEAVELVGPYTQREAPSLLQRADLLLHTKYNDPCPTIVLEALACGLPVVYSATGGVPELVSHDAGVGIPAPLDWEHDHPPAPAELAAGVLDAAERLEERSEAARTHALRFDSRAWIARHRAVFEELVHPGGPDDATGILSRS
jgi:glycosyltransferase involved in cell wall biosynthesis